MKTIIFPEVLVRTAKLGGERFDGTGSTVGELLAGLAEQHPSLRGHLYYENGRFKEHFLVTRQGELVDLDTALSDGDEVEIMLATSGGVGAGTLSNEEVQRYVRHITLPGVGRTGQQRLKQAKVLIIGTGGLGSPACLYLAAAGVGTIGLVDFDVVESSNLQRQVVHGFSTLGMPKVDSAQRRVLDLNPYIAVVTHRCAIDADNAQELIQSYDLVLDGTDNFATRYLVNAVCAKLQKPLVFGAINRFEGQVSVFNLGDGPCYQCLFPNNPPPELAPSCNAGGVIGVLPGVIGLLQATEAVKAILGLGKSLSGRLLRFDALHMNFNEVKFNRRTDCPACSRATDANPRLWTEGLLCQTNAAPSQRLADDHYIDPGRLQQLMESGEESYALLDVRDAGELEVCQLPGVVHVPLSDLGSQLDNLDADKRHILVCYAGTRAERAAMQLIEAGFSKVQVLDGGMKRWAKEIERDMPMY
ncbi:molybdopterin-synthase adenylyltransferase MoeB [Bordetella genomosp. 1]|uniref:Molybdenum cofactor biosynthesis protein MoeB n=1 Tax=Bordetella genomosp. 1 TaxID=1395607 RepID=A0ABX4EZV2_9BORD|nr:molybdopterin-synthase adenylyltransferase MoeB [Bordetella genomosp. 1]OZI65285.1 molybdenum cofactor biosynthesis protein MoeB [Bordetella genomosp. 1]